MKIIEGGVCAAEGFSAAGLNAGIKNNGKKDMAMVFCEAPCVKAGTFTTNRAQAAPVKWDKKVVSESASVRAVVVNTGIANACTGAEGDKNCRRMAAGTADALGISEDAVLVASTGVIGKQLPMDVIMKGIKELPGRLAGTEKAATEAAEAIMTTDTRPKQAAVEVEIDGVSVHIGGMCKGSGMIHPNMATMLCFITTDADIEEKLLQKAVSDIVEDTFNMISVDGDTSTNDSVLVLADGMADNKKIDSKDSASYKTFYDGLYYILCELSKKIAGDGEGATCLFEVQVLHGKDKETARRLAKSVVSSNLTKAAIFGHDANWGRILCAMGYSGADFNPDTVDLSFESRAGKIEIARNGLAVDYSEETAAAILKEEHVKAVIDVKCGDASATAYGCDLTFDYVKINADYRS